MYALENGNTRAAIHFSKLLDHKILESTTRRLKAEHIQALTQSKGSPESVYWWNHKEDQYSLGKISTIQWKSMSKQPEQQGELYM